MTDPVNSQDTQENSNEQEIQDGDVSQNENNVQEESEIPENNNNQEASELEKLKQELEKERLKAQEEAQKRAVLEGRYQEIDRSRNQGVPSNVQQPSSLRDIIKVKTKGMAESIIENPEGASEILTEALMTLVENVKNESINTVKFQNDIDSTLANIERDNPHLSQFKTNIQANAAELMQRGECRNLREALNKAAEKLNEAFTGFARNKGLMSSNLSNEKITSKGNQGNVSSIKTVSKTINARPENPVTIDQEFKERNSRVLKKRI